MDIVQNLGVNFLLELPILLVAFVGLVAGIIYLRRSTAVSVLTLCASLLYLLQAVAGLGLFSLLPRFLMEHDWEPASVVTAMRALRLLQSLAVAVALALFLAAIFKGRKAMTKAAQPNG